jgi:hypothetical protein
MFRVPVPVMDVVGVIVMRDSDMAAAFGVHVLMVPMNFVRTGYAFVDVVTVRAVYVGVVRVIDMILMRERHMPAIRAVNVRMVGMRPRTPAPGWRGLPHERALGARDAP